MQSISLELHGLLALVTLTAISSLLHDVLQAWQLELPRMQFPNNNSNHDVVDNKILIISHLNDSSSFLTFSMLVL